MTDREKIIKGLECCRIQQSGVPPICEACPYADDAWGTCKDMGDLLNDAYEMLKAQEPRLLTCADFEANPMLDDDGRLPCWCEDKVGRDGWAAVSVGGVRPDHIKANGCRYWTSRPTDEQREAEKWDDV